MLMNSDQYKLQLGGFPLINNLADLANLMHLSKGILYRLAKHNDKYYKKMKVKKKNGGFRDIYCPSREMKGIQAWILRNVLDKIYQTDCATAFIRKRNIRYNAEIHKENRYLLCLDIKDFFPSIHYKKVYTIFKTLGYNPHVSHILTSYCTCNGILPQGGVTSPAISNAICIRLDNRISGYVGKHNITYSRYADDMAFSSKTPGPLVGIRKFVIKIIKDEGFFINEGKTRFLGPRKQLKITGLVLSENNVGIGRKKKRILRAKIHNMIRKNHSKVHIDKLVAFIRGWFAFLSNIDPKALKQFKTYLKKLERKYRGKRQLLQSLVP
jgi:RNA-directed DNA polymerase